jgi:hypothetical protein
MLGPNLYEYESGLCRSFRLLCSAALQYYIVLRMSPPTSYHGAMACTSLHAKAHVRSQGEKYAAISLMFFIHFLCDKMIGLA